MFRIAEIGLGWKIRSESRSKPVAEFRALFFTFAQFSPVRPIPAPEHGKLRIHSVATRMVGLACVFCPFLRYSRGLQTYMLPLPLPACFPRLAWICVPPSCQIQLLFRYLDSEPNTAADTGVRANSKHHEVLARSIKKQRCMLCSCERSCSFPIKNGLKGLRQARLDEPSSAAPCFAPWLRCEDSETMDTCGEQGSETGKT